MKRTREERGGGGLLFIHVHHWVREEGRGVPRGVQTHVSSGGNGHEGHHDTARP